MNEPINLRELAAVARSSELHDLKVGLTPDEADSVADEIDRLQSKLEKERNNGVYWSEKLASRY